MSEKKTDRRVRYTQMVIRESFIALLAQKSVSKVTVKEICARADVNRATFYAHYADTYDLLNRIEDEFTENITLHVAGSSFQDLEGAAPLKALTSICAYIQENAELCTVLFSQNGNIEFLTQIMEIVGRHFVADWKEARNLDQEKAEYIVHFAMGGSVQLIRKWLNDGMKLSPEEMADMLLTLGARGSTALF
jgi:AcrR family transcriptional regulator